MALPHELGISWQPMAAGLKGVFFFLLGVAAGRLSTPMQLEPIELSKLVIQSEDLKVGGACFGGEGVCVGGTGR